MSLLLGLLNITFKYLLEIFSPKKLGDVYLRHLPTPEKTHGEIPSITSVVSLEDDFLVGRMQSVDDKVGASVDGLSGRVPCGENHLGNGGFAA